MILEMRNICKDYPMGKTVTRVLRDEIGRAHV